LKLTREGKRAAAIEEIERLSLEIAWRQSWRPCTKPVGAAQPFATLRGFLARIQRLANTSLSVGAASRAKRAAIAVGRRMDQ